MNLLSIQSHVAYGHVGNAAAVFPLQRLGCEVWPIHTVQFSNHPGHGTWRGRVVDAEAIGDVVLGLSDLGVLPDCDGVLSGYLGSAETGAAVLDAVARVKAANPRARYCCDPVIGDVGRGVFVRPGVPEFFRDRALAVADLVTPNQFELEYLAGRATATLNDTLQAIALLHGLGPSVVLVTSLHTAETPADALDLLASDGSRSFRVRTPRLPISVNGAGDAVAALFFFHFLASGSAREALSRAASSIFGVLKRTLQAQSGEILLVGAQEELVDPSEIFEAKPVG
jgi:pyridoxine kinase